MFPELQLWLQVLLAVVVAFIIVCVVGALLVGSGIGIFVALFGQ